MKSHIFFIPLCLFLQTSMAQKMDISMFPKAKEGFRQLAISVPAKANENDFKIEFFVGKVVQVDKCNRHFILGNIEKKLLEGWGYDFFEVSSKGETAGTIMGCPDNSKIAKFIHIQPVLERYNSKLPIVLYVPDGFEVRYRIWSAGTKMLKAN